MQVRYQLRQRPEANDDTTDTRPPPRYGGIPGPDRPVYGATEDTAGADRSIAPHPLYSRCRSTCTA